MKVDPTLVRSGSNPPILLKTNNIDGKDNRQFNQQTERHEQEEIGPIVVELQESKNIPINSMHDGKID